MTEYKETNCNAIFMVGVVVICLILMMMVSGCATMVKDTRYYDDSTGAVINEETKHIYGNVKAFPIRKIKLRGIGEADVDGDKYKVSSEPWVKTPEFPDIELNK